MLTASYKDILREDGSLGDLVRKIEDEYGWLWLVEELDLKVARKAGKAVLCKSVSTGATRYIYPHHLEFSEPEG